MAMLNNQMVYRYNHHQLSAAIFSALYGHEAHILRAALGAKPWDGAPIQLPYKWLNYMVYGRYIMIYNYI